MAGRGTRGNKGGISVVLSGLSVFHCFAGAGGGMLADILLGHDIVGAIEIEEYPREVLLKRQADGILPRFPIWDDVCTFRADNPDTQAYIEGLRGIRDNLIIAGGFPCQDVSIAGKGDGLSGSRSGLYYEFERIIGEVRPRYVFIENSPMLIKRGLKGILPRLASMGYACRGGIIGADDTGAPHVRKRFWMWCERREEREAYPYPDGDGCERIQRSEKDNEGGQLSGSEPEVPRGAES